MSLCQLCIHCPEVAIEGAEIPIGGGGKPRGPQEKRMESRGPPQQRRGAHEGRGSRRIPCGGGTPESPARAHFFFRDCWPFDGQLGVAAASPGEATPSRQTPTNQ